MYILLSIDFQVNCFYNYFAVKGIKYMLLCKCVLRNNIIFVISVPNYPSITGGTMFLGLFYTSLILDDTDMIRTIYFVDSKRTQVNIRYYLNMNSENEVFRLTRLGLARVYCTYNFLFPIG